jgi:hypothetical protein
MEDDVEDELEFDHDLHQTLTLESLMTEMNQLRAEVGLFRNARPQQAWAAAGFNRQPHTIQIRSFWYFSHVMFMSLSAAATVNSTVLFNQALGAVAGPLLFFLGGRSSSSAMRL